MFLYWCYLWNEISAFHTKAFFQLIIRHKIKLSFISETEEGAKDKIVERATERERALGSGGYSVGCKMDRYIIHMFAKQDCQHLERLLLISKKRNLANEVSHNRSVLTAKYLKRWQLNISSQLNKFETSWILLRQPEMNLEQPFSYNYSIPVLHLK